MRRSVLVSLVAMVITAAISHNSSNQGLVRAAKSQGAGMKNSWWSKRSSGLPTGSASDLYVGNTGGDASTDGLAAKPYMMENLAESTLSEERRGGGLDLPSPAFEMFMPCFPSGATYEPQPPLSCYMALSKALKALSKRNRDNLAKLLVY